MNFRKLQLIVCFGFIKTLDRVCWKVLMKNVYFMNCQKEGSK